MKKKSAQFGFDDIRSKLKLKNLEQRQKILKKYPSVDKIFSERGIDIGRIREHSARLLGAGIISGTLLLGQPDTAHTLPAPDYTDPKEIENALARMKTKKEGLVETLTAILPATARPLNRNEEKMLEGVFKNYIGVDARAGLEGEHLNQTYGYIGAEQHLIRYPGDSIVSHGDPQIQRSGMAPGKGAWGYFANSASVLTDNLSETEKWYAVVQTLYLPDWGTRQPYLKNWYKYRKVLIVNTKNGNAVVAAIADSGPAAWTGKHYGGSPEVMYHLGGQKYKKGAVIVFFVNDPDNKVPLGPVEYEEINLNLVETEIAT
ncbi:MAG TPA: hypothetical protein VI819_05115 [Patescibacteria group bacterium]|nr:hypothetical protein [Patescibacteria group bacterium]